MSRKFYFSFVVIVTLVTMGHIIGFAQYAPVSGRVEMLKADGTREPVAGALIEVYRVDIKGGAPSAKTNKKGEFAFAGLLLQATYVFGVSAPGCAPHIFPNVRAGSDKLVIALGPGDGNKLSEDDVRKGATVGSINPGSGELSADQKKQQAEIAAKNAAILASNEKIKNGDEVAANANTEGTAALKADNYDLAIAKFDEGVAAVPDFIGSTPILLNGKMVALKLKGFKIYREGVALTDLDARRAKYAEANKHYDGAISAFQMAVDVIKKAGPAPDPAEQKGRDQLRSELYAAAIEIYRLKVVGGVDSTKVGDANTVINEYLGLEADPARKLSAQMTLGDIMRLSGDFEKAVAAYRKVLEMKPDYPDAMAGLGLTLFAQGAAISPEDKEKEQEGLNYMQKYTEIAPIMATDPQNVKELKASVKEAVDYLKSQKMAPQKLPTTKKKP